MVFPEYILMLSKIYLNYIILNTFDIAIASLIFLNMQHIIKIVINAVIDRPMPKYFKLSILINYLKAPMFSVYP